MNPATAMQQPYNLVTSAAEEAYVDVRVCDLHVHQGNMPKGLDDTLQINGLYVVLRCRDEVHRTSCLWLDESGDAASTYAASSEDDLVWNELFRFSVPSTMPPTSLNAKQLYSQPASSALQDNSQGRFSDPYPASSSSTAMTTPLLSSSVTQLPPSGVAAGIGSPLLYPTIEIELWRSTPLSENFLSRYAYHVPLELTQAGYDLSSLDTVVERVVPLETKEAPSIMGNLYGWRGHQLTVRLRVQAVGLAPLVSAWAQWQGNKKMMKTAPNMISADAYSFVPATETAGSMMPGASQYMEAGGCGAPMGTLHPVLANLLAPFGVSTGAGTAGHPAPSMMMMMPVSEGIGGNNLQNPTQPPLFSLYPSAPDSTTVVGAGATYHYASGVPPIIPQSSGPGILGDGDLAWRSITAQPTGYPLNGPPQQQ